MKNGTLVLAFFAVLFLASCADAGYVNTAPFYTEMQRPRQPSPLHIWIEGDWIWQKHSKSYQRREGHWDMPKAGRSYSQGYWESKAKGKHWIAGKWH